MTRFKRFIGHYKQLRLDKLSDAETLMEFLMSQWPLGYRHSKSMWNCIIYSWSNSKTHNLDGSKRKYGG